MSHLPNGWHAAPIGEIGRWCGGGTPSKGNRDFWKDGTIPWVSPKDMKRFFISSTEDQITSAAVAESATQLIPKGSILLVTRSGILRHSLPVAVNNCEVAINQDLKALIPYANIDPVFVAKQVQSLAQNILASCAKSGTTVDSIDFDQLKAVAVQIPPLPEQQRVVAKIDSLSGKSQRAREHLDHIPRLVEKYKQAILGAAFRGDLTHEWRKSSLTVDMRLHLDDVRTQRRTCRLSNSRRTALEKLPTPPSDLPTIPKAWAWSCVEELASDNERSIQSGPFGSSLLHSEFQDDGILAIGIDNVRDGYFSLGAENRISAKKFKELERFVARPGDVVITVMATIGRTCVLPDDIEKSIITKHVYRISVDERLVVPKFLMNGLRGAEIALAHMGANIRGQTRPGINGEILKSLFLPLPSLLEQKEIVCRIDAAFAWIDRLASETTSTRKLIDHLDQAILAKAFRGELVPQNPNDEPASALLERAKAERAAGGNKKANNRPAPA